MKIISRRNLQVVSDIPMSSLGALLSSMSIKTNMSELLSKIKTSDYYVQFPELVKTVKFVKFLDNSWKFYVMPPTATSLIKNYSNNGVISVNDINHIAEIKMSFMNVRDISGAVKCIKATAKNIGIGVL